MSVIKSDRAMRWTSRIAGLLFLVFLLLPQTVPAVRPHAVGGAVDLRQELGAELQARMGKHRKKVQKRLLRLKKKVERVLSAPRYEEGIRLALVLVLVGVLLLILGLFLPIIKWAANLLVSLGVLVLVVMLVLYLLDVVV